MPAAWSPRGIQGLHQKAMRLQRGATLSGRRATFLLSPLRWERRSTEAAGRIPVPLGPPPPLPNGYTRWPVELDTSLINRPSSTRHSLMVGLVRFGAMEPRERSHQASSFHACDDVQRKVSVGLAVGRRPKHDGTFFFLCTSRGHPELSLYPQNACTQAAFLTCRFRFFGF